MKQVCYFLDKLKNLLNEEVLLGFITDNANYDKLIFRENSEGSAIKKLNIDHIPKNSIAFTLDFRPYSQLSQYLNAHNADGINKSCDIVIIVGEGCDYDVYLFDLKSEKIRPKDCSIQLKNSELFINYLNLLMTNYYSDECKNMKIRKLKRIIGSSNNRLSKNSGRPNDNRNEFKNFLPLTINKTSNGEGYISFKKF